MLNIERELFLRSTKLFLFKKVIETALIGTFKGKPTINEKYKILFPSRFKIRCVVFSVFTGGEQGLPTIYRTQNYWHLIRDYSMKLFLRLRR